MYTFAKFGIIVKLLFFVFSAFLITIFFIHFKLHKCRIYNKNDFVLSGAPNDAEVINVA